MASLAWIEADVRQALDPTARLTLRRLRPRYPPAPFRRAMRLMPSRVPPRRETNALLTS
jgi:hypothetical protein